MSTTLIFCGIHLNLMPIRKLAYSRLSSRNAGLEELFRTSILLTLVNSWTKPVSNGIQSSWKTGNLPEFDLCFESVQTVLQRTALGCRATVCIGSGVRGGRSQTLLSIKTPCHCPSAARESAWEAPCEPICSLDGERGHASLFRAAGGFLRAFYTGPHPGSGLDDLLFGAGEGPGLPLAADLELHVRVGLCFER